MKALNGRTSTLRNMMLKIKRDLIEGKQANKWIPSISNDNGIMTLEISDDDRDKFIHWNDRLINAFERVHRGTRLIFKGMNKDWMQDDLHTSWPKRQKEIQQGKPKQPKDMD